MSSDFSSIGEVLASLETDFPDVTISKIRFLESQGLLTPERTQSGYRKFRSGDIDQLRWILTQQRDNFLPLRVIRERIDSGNWSNADLEDGANLAAPPQTNGATAVQRNFDLAVSADLYSIDEIAAQAGLDIAEVRDLQKYGVIDPVVVDPAPMFDDDSLQITKTAAAFMSHGVEPRHLKAWKTAAEREAGILEQLTVPLARQSASNSRAKAISLAGDLVQLGGDLRYAMLRRSLRSSLGDR